MKHINFFTLLMVFAITLTSCAKANAEPADGMINPGDKIGDFLITTGEEGDVTYTWDLGCNQQGNEEVYSCKATVNTKVNVSVGIYDDQYSGKLDELWAGHTYELFIEDRPVNLVAFGFIDTIHPAVGKMRHWNVVVVATNPGEITLRDSGVADGDSFEATTTYTFSAP